MKSIVQFINENIEVEQGPGDYKVVVLARREGIELSSITEEDFIKFIREDVDKAIKEYSAIISKFNVKYREWLIKTEVDAAVKYAEKKWKTDKKRNEYVENIKKNAEEKPRYTYKAEDIYFDFKPTPSNSISGSCVISKKSTTRDLKEAYKILMQDKYFLCGKGWALKYETTDETRPYSFRPWIDVLLDESDREEQNRDEEMLRKSIEAFYSNTNYWGD